MNNGIRNAAAALLVLAAGSGLVACSETVDVAPASSVRKEVKEPKERCILQPEVDRDSSADVKPLEHQSRTKYNR